MHRKQFISKALSSLGAFFVPHTSLVEVPASKEKKQKLVKYPGHLIENTTFVCNPKHRLHFQPGARINNCIFKWTGACDGIWGSEHSSLDNIYLMTGSNIILTDCLFYGSGIINEGEIANKI